MSGVSEELICLIDLREKVRLFGKLTSFISIDC